MGIFLRARSLTLQARSALLCQQGRGHGLLPEDGGDLAQPHEGEELQSEPSCPLPRRHHRHGWSEPGDLLPRATGQLCPVIPESVSRLVPRGEDLIDEVLLRVLPGHSQVGPRPQLQRGAEAGGQDCQGNTAVTFSQ